MTSAQEPGPIAPRRPLGKPPAGTDGGETAPAGSTQGQATSNGSKSSSWSAPSNVAPSPDVAPPVASPSGPAAPVAPPLYHPEPNRPGGNASTAYTPGGVDVETQQHLPPSPMRVIPPPPVDKRAERAAARAQRKLDQRKPRTVRRAKLRVVRVDPWSVTKAAFLLSIAFAIMCVVAVFLVFSIMSASGLWDSVNTTIQGVVNQKPTDAFDIRDYVGMSRVMGITMLIAAIDVVIITALATLGAFIYNMAASLLGGIEVTLAEDLR